jgi:hypothetical protein
MWGREKVPDLFPGFQLPIDLIRENVRMPYSLMDGGMADRLQLSLIPTRKTTLRIPVDLHRRLKITAIQENRQMTDIVVDAIETYLSKNRTSLSGPSPKR